jgi:hypothetical protein
VTVVSIEVQKAKQRKREHGFQDFWAGIEGKRSFGACAELITAKLAGIKEHPQ